MDNEEKLAKCVHLMLGATNEHEATAAFRKAREIQPDGNLRLPREDREDDLNDVFEWRKAGHKRSYEEKTEARPEVRAPAQDFAWYSLIGMLKTYPSRADREIARLFGYSPTTVGKVRRELGLGKSRKAKRN